MDKADFYRRYPVLSGYLASDFAEGVIAEDERTAAEIVADLRRSSASYGKNLRQLVAEARGLRGGLDSEWQVLDSVVLREFDGRAAAEAWLLKVLAVWEKALQDAESGRKP